MKTKFYFKIFLIILLLIIIIVRKSNESISVSTKGTDNITIISIIEKYYDEIK